MLMLFLSTCVLFPVRKTSVVYTVHSCYAAFKRRIKLKTDCIRKGTLIYTLKFNAFTVQLRIVLYLVIFNLYLYLCINPPGACVSPLFTSLGLLVKFSVAVLLDVSVAVLLDVGVAVLLDVGVAALLDVGVAVLLDVAVAVLLDVGVTVLLDVGVGGILPAEFTATTLMV